MYRVSLERLARAYELDPDKRRDLLQEIHLQLWRSFGLFDGRCSLKTWVYRVAHHTATSHVIRKRRIYSNLVGLEELDTAGVSEAEVDVDRLKALDSAKAASARRNVVKKHKEVYPPKRVRFALVNIGASLEIDSVTKAA